MINEEIVTKLMYFYDYIGKEKVRNYLKQLGLLEGSFSQYEDVYREFRLVASEKEKGNFKLLTSKTLAHGLEKKFITEHQLDNLLFLSIEDTLLNSYLYRLEEHNVDLDCITDTLKEWSFNQELSLLKSVSPNKKGKKFIQAAYRIYKDDGKVNSVRLLLFDEELVNLYEKNKGGKLAVYPTIVEVDFARKLIHVRVREVDKIESENEEVGTLSKRIEERTLKYISSLGLKIKKFTNFRKSLFEIEEDILSKERAEAEIILQSFKGEIDSFVGSITSQLNVPLEKRISPKKQIEYSVLALISNTLKNNELGDIVGIKFRNIREENSKKYSEVYISDKEYKGISTDDLYWNNLSVLIEQGRVEFLQLVKGFPSGTVIANLNFTLDTANAKILKKNANPDKDIHQPYADRSYLELIDYLLPFLFLKPKN